MKNQKWFAALGLPQSATLEQVTKAYRRLAQQHHPDRNKDPKSTKRFQEIEEAYRNLVGSPSTTSAKKRNRSAAKPKKPSSPSVFSDKKYATALLQAVQDGNADYVRCFLEGGANPNWNDCIIHATEREYESIVKILLDGGANPNSTRQEYRGIVNLRNSGADPLRGHFKALTIAVERQNPQIVKFLLDGGADPNSEISEEEEDFEEYFSGTTNIRRKKGTVLTMAVERQNPEIVKRLLFSKADPNLTAVVEEHHKVVKESSALATAVENQNLQIVKLLLDGGADPNSKIFEASFGDTASARRKKGTVLTMAVERQNPEIVKSLLFSKADPNLTAVVLEYRKYNDKAVKEESALTTAAENQNPEIVKLLLDGGADPNRATLEGPVFGSIPDDLHGINRANDCEGFGDRAKESTALTIAVKRQNPQIVKLLLDGGADPSVALTTAVKNENIEIVKLLLDGGTKSKKKRGFGDRSGTPKSPNRQTSP